ncbi:MAG: glucose 1-dehydrogenase [Chloroflexia bacterium]|nr:glucose 1-dehydrogenase [Chloroflexia bacterium]
MGHLEGRSALVTGSGIGIGEGIARELARQGARVALHYAASAQGAHAAMAEITAAGGEAIALQGDLRFVADCTRVVNEAAETFGGLDILVNNAGVTRAQPFEDTTEDLYDEMFDLNMKGYFFCAQTALPYLEASGHGSIINITSIHGGGGFPNHAAYAGTKGAVIGFTRSLAIELAPRGVRVNAIGPGVIEVPRYFDMPGYTTAFGHTLLPIGRVGLPQDIAPAVAFLAGDGAAFITGQTLFVDGGTNARMGLFWETPAQ